MGSNFGEPWNHPLFWSGSTSKSDTIGPAVVISIVASVALLLGLRLVPLRILKRNQDPKQGCDTTQVFFLAHVMINSIICILTFHDVLRVLYDPITNGYKGEYDLLPTVIQIGFHVAHMITDYRTLKVELWVHHILSSVLLGIFDLCYTYGPLLNFALFFGTGLPGGLNYAIQFARKISAVRRSEADLLYSRIDTWIRAPSLVICMAFGHACWAAGQRATPSFVQVCSAEHALLLHSFTITMPLLSSCHHFRCTAAAAPTRR